MERFRSKISRSAAAMDPATASLSPASAWEILSGRSAELDQFRPTGRLASFAAASAQPFASFGLGDNFRPVGRRFVAAILAGFGSAAVPPLGKPGATFRTGAEGWRISAPLSPFRADRIDLTLGHAPFALPERVSALQLL